VEFAAAQNNTLRTNQHKLIGIINSIEVMADVV
jgi:hypothetical protein